MFLINRPFFGRNRLPKASTLWQNQQKRRVLQKRPLRVRRDRHATSTSSGRYQRSQRGRKPQSVGRPKRKRPNLRQSYWVLTIAKENSIRSCESRKRNSFSFETPWSIPWRVLPRTLCGRELRAARLPL